MEQFQPQQEKNRVAYIDLAKGLCIMMVVLYHVLNSYEIHEYACADMLRVFRMPLYFFLSGLFFKTYESYVDFLRRKVNKLLIPFLTFYTLIVVFLTYLLHIVGINPQENLWQPLYAFVYPEDWEHNVPLWFLLCLFILNNIFYWLFLLAKRISERYQVAILVVLTFLTGAAGYYMANERCNLPMFIDSAMTAMPFFMVGFLVRKYTPFLQPNRWDRYNWIIIIGGLLYCFLLGRYENFRTQTYETNIAVLYSAGLLGAMAVLLLSKQIGYIPFISYCGRYSIMILVIHRPIASEAVALARYLNLPTWLGVTLAFLTTVVITSSLIPFMRRRMGYVTAQKDLIKVNNN